MNSTPTKITELVFIYCYGRYCVRRSVSPQVPENPSGPLVDNFIVLPCVAFGVACVKLLPGVDRWNSLDDPRVIGPSHCEVWGWPVTARFVTRFNLWLRHDLWPHNASICDPARFVTKSASICDQRYTMILESKLCRGKLVFVFTLIMYTKWYNMIIYIYMNYDMMLI